MIINKLALFINDFLLSCFNNGIKFYQILIGLFIFNFIIYCIYNLLKIGKKRYY